MLCVVSTQYKIASRKKVRFLLSVHRKFPVELLYQIELSRVLRRLWIGETGCEGSYFMRSFRGHSDCHLDPSESSVPISLKPLSLRCG